MKLNGDGGTLRRTEITVQLQTSLHFNIQNIEEILIVYIT